jgi:cobalamin biosynthesis protein CobT
MWFDQPAFKGLPGGGLDALLGGSGTDDEDDEMHGDEEDASGDDEGVRTVWDEMGEGSEGEEDEDEDESDEESDDDFRGAREEFVEDEEMEDEADIDAQEKAEIEKAERIASAFVLPLLTAALADHVSCLQSSA